MKGKPSVVSKNTKGDVSPGPVEFMLQAKSGKDGVDYTRAAGVGPARGVPDFDPNQAIVMVSTSYGANYRAGSKAAFRWDAILVDGITGSSLALTGQARSTHVGKRNALLAGKGKGYVTSAAGDVFCSIEVGDPVTFKLGNDGGVWGLTINPQ